MRKTLATFTTLTLVLLAVAALPGAAAVPPGATGTWNPDKVHSEVGFQVRHFVSKVRGAFTDFSGSIKIEAEKPETSSVEFTIKVASINTNEPKRDAHLKSPDFFDAEKFPEIRFVSKKVVRKSDSTYDVVGDLTMRGVTKEVTLPVTFTGLLKTPFGDERAGFETSITLNRQDYGIKYNKVLDQGGMMLGDDVAISISLETVKAKPAAAK
ncbi:MAG: YceI family protein [Thermoanaerobaculia bacterium]